MVLGDSRGRGSARSAVVVGKPAAKRFLKAVSVNKVERGMREMAFQPLTSIFATVGVSAIATEASCVKWVGDVALRPLSEKLRRAVGRRSG